MLEDKTIGLLAQGCYCILEHSDFIIAHGSINGRAINTDVGHHPRQIYLLHSEFPEKHIKTCFEESAISSLEDYVLTGKRSKLHDGLCASCIGYGVRGPVPEFVIVFQVTVIDKDNGDSLPPRIIQDLLYQRDDPFGAWDDKGTVVIDEILEHVSY